MRRTLLAFGLAGLGCVFAFSPAWAETLEEAWSRALQVDEGLKAADALVTSSEQALASAKAQRLPALTVEGGYFGLTDPPSFDIEKGLGKPLPRLPERINLPRLGRTIEIPQIFPDLSTYSLGQRTYGSAQASVRLPLYTGGRLSGTIDAAKANLEGSRHEHVHAIQELKLSVAQAYVNVLRAQDAVKVTEEEVKSLDAHVKDVDDVYQHGFVAKNDLLATQVAEAQAKERHLQAQNMLELARSAYNRLLERPMDSPVSLDPVVPPKDVLPLEDYVEAAKTNRPEPKALSAQTQALRDTAKALRGGMMPQLALIGGYMYMDLDSLDKNSYGYGGVGLSWNLFDFGATAKQAGSVSSRGDSARERLLEAQELIALEVRQTWFDVKESLYRIEVAKTALARADENLKVNRDRYRQGLGTNTEVLDAQTQRTGAYVNYNQAVYDSAYNEMRLRKAAGEL